jgi:hypothetical protein
MAIQNTENNSSLKYKRYKVTRSDWITFLSSEKNNLTSVYFTILAIVVTLFSIFSKPSNSQLLSINITIMLLLIMVLAYMYWWSPIIKRVNISNDILKKIVSGKLDDPGQIRNEWVSRMEHVNISGGQNMNNFLKIVGILVGILACIYIVQQFGHAVGWW